MVAATAEPMTATPPHPAQQSVRSASDADTGLRTAIGSAILDSLPGTAPADAADPLDLLSATAQAETIGRELLADAVRSARGAGCSWAAIGAKLGMSRQAAQQRFGAAPAEPAERETPRGDGTAGDDERWLGPVTVMDEMAELAAAGRLGWRSVEVGWFRHRVRRTDTQWEHRRTVWTGARSAQTEGWEVAARAFPWVYLVRDTGRPAADS